MNDLIPIYQIQTWASSVLERRMPQMKEEKRLAQVQFANEPEIITVQDSVIIPARRRRRRYPITMKAVIRTVHGTRYSGPKVEQIVEVVDISSRAMRVKADVPVARGYRIDATVDWPAVAEVIGGNRGLILRIHGCVIRECRDGFVVGWNIPPEFKTIPLEVLL